MAEQKTSFERKLFKDEGLKIEIMMNVKTINFSSVTSNIEIFSVQSLLKQTKEQANKKTKQNEAKQWPYS